MHIFTGIKSTVFTIGYENTPRVTESATVDITHYLSQATGEYLVL